MKIRVTVMMDDDVLEKARKLQIDRMIKEDRTLSLSEVINDTVRKSMKK